MEIADHAGETNGPEPVEETGARQGRGERTRERKLTKTGGGKLRGDEGGRKRGMNEGGRLFRVDNHRQHSSGSTHGVMSTTRDAAA